jgi:hypothetical protein
MGQALGAIPAWEDCFYHNLICLNLSSSLKEPHLQTVELDEDIRCHRQYFIGYFNHGYNFASSIHMDYEDLK